MNGMSRHLEPCAPDSFAFVHVFWEHVRRCIDVVGHGGACVPRTLGRHLYGRASSGARYLGVDPVEEVELATSLRRMRLFDGLCLAIETDLGLLFCHRLTPEKRRHV
jgi:hypothetical protein